MVPRHTRSSLPPTALALVAAALVAAGAQRGADAAGDPTARGPHPIATAAVDFDVGGTPARLDLTYPTSGSPGPAVVILPSGVLGGGEYNAGHAAHLASWGFVVGVVARAAVTGGSDIATNAARASAALDALRAAPVVAGRVTDRAAVVGTHLNGPSAVRAAVDDPRFRAVVGLHPAPVPNSASRGPDLRVPLLGLGGRSENGLLCVVGSRWEETVLRAGSAHKAAFLFRAAHPADFQDPANDDPFDFCGAPRATPFPWVRGLLTAWLSYYVLGDATFYDAIYVADGGPQEPPDVLDQDSLADNAPRGLAAVPAGTDGARITWTAAITDATVLAGYDLLRSRAGGPFERLAAPGLLEESALDAGLEAGATYAYTLRYRDWAGHVFATATPVSIVGGAPTPAPTSPTPTRTPTRTPPASSTPRPSATPTWTATPRVSGTPPVLEFEVQLPLLVRNSGPN